MKRSASPLSALVCATLIVTACGTSDDTSSATTDGQPPETAETVAAAPQSEAEPEPEPTDPAPAAPTSFTSPDGRLTIDAPADGTDVSITEVEATYDVPEEIETLATYEFGPDGATFDPPLNVEVELDANLDTDAISATHVSSDGTVEPLDVEFTSTGVRFELSSFSSVHLGVIRANEFRLRAPDRVEVGGEFEVEATLEQAAPAGMSVEESTPGTVIGPFPIWFDADIAVSGPIERRGTSFSCASRGDGTVSVDGPIAFDVVANGVWANLQRATASLGVECFNTGRYIPPTDTTCSDASGAASDGCPSVEELNALFGWTDGEFVAEVNVLGGTVTTFSLAAGGNVIRVAEYSSDGTTQGFLVPSYASYQLNGTEITVERVLEVFALKALVGLSDDDAVSIVFPGGKNLVDDTTLELVTAALIDFTIYVETAAGLLGTYSWDPVLFRQLFEGA